MLRSMIVQNQIRSNPRVCATGKKTGKVTIIIDRGSIIHPIINKTICIIMSVKRGERPRPDVTWTKP